MVKQSKINAFIADIIVFAIIYESSSRKKSTKVGLSHLISFVSCKIHLYTLGEGLNMSQFMLLQATSTDRFELITYRHRWVDELKLDQLLPRINWQASAFLLAHVLDVAYLWTAHSRT